MTTAPQFCDGAIPRASAHALIAEFKSSALTSPFRSTVPLLALAKDDWPTFQKVITACGLTGNAFEVSFEYTVHSPGSEGRRPSYTDAMVCTESDALAIEAKWTEPRYETVAKRLRKKDSTGQDSRAFIEGWLQLLQPHAAAPLALDDFSECVYQVVHRSASACGTRKRPRLAYLHFTHAMPERNTATSEQYIRDLSQVHALLGHPASFPFFVVDVPVRPTAAFEAIASLKKGAAETGRLVREAIGTEVLFEFGEPQVHPIEPVPSPSI